MMIQETQPHKGSDESVDRETSPIMPSANIWSNFKWAIAGLVYAIRTQRCMRFHLAATIGVTLLGLYLGLTGMEWAVTALVIAMVWIAELTNTVAETLVDLATDKYHPLAKKAKDIAAGAVLVAAAAAIIIAAVIFVPKLLVLLL